MNLPQPSKWNFLLHCTQQLFLFHIDPLLGSSKLLLHLPILDPWSVLMLLRIFPFCVLAHILTVCLQLGQHAHSETSQSYLHSLFWPIQEWSSPFYINYSLSFIEVCWVQSQAYFPIIQIHPDQTKMLSGSLTAFSSSVNFLQSLDYQQTLLY